MHDWHLIFHMNSLKLPWDALLMINALLSDSSNPVHRFGGVNITLQNLWDLAQLPLWLAQVVRPLSRRILRTGFSSVGRIRSLVASLGVGFLGSVCLIEEIRLAWWMLFSTWWWSLPFGSLLLIILRLESAGGRQDSWIEAINLVACGSKCSSTQERGWVIVESTSRCIETRLNVLLGLRDFQIWGSPNRFVGLQVQIQKLSHQ